jgi:hypothetical protein
MKAKRDWQPYVMPPLRHPIERPTVLDPSDPRIPTVYPPKLTPEQLRVIERPGAVDPRLRIADRLLERWAAGPATHLIWPGLAYLRFMPRSSSATPLPDYECRLIDAAVRGAPAWAGTFVLLWYRSGYTAQEIAEMLKIRRRQAVYEERHLVLAYFLGRFAEAGLSLPNLAPEA